MMRLLLTNDDGIDAPGLQALYESTRLAFQAYSPEIIVVAPDRQRSECGHSVSDKSSFQLQQTKPNWYSVDGTPVDCIRVALGSVAADPTFCFSGINAGANLGVNLMVSGTFAAAREAAVHGIRSMAVSQYRRPDVPKTWAHCPLWLTKVLTEYAETKDNTILWNVNLPALDPDSPAPPHAICEVDQCPFERIATKDGNAVSFKVDFHGRPRKPGTDVDRCFGGNLTISKLTPHFVTRS